MDELNYRKSVMNFWTGELYASTQKVERIEESLKVLVMSPEWRHEQEKELAVAAVICSSIDDEQFYAWQAWTARCDLNAEIARLRAL